MYFSCPGRYRRMSSSGAGSHCWTGIIRPCCPGTSIANRSFERPDASLASDGLVSHLYPMLPSLPTPVGPADPPPSPVPSLAQGANPYPTPLLFTCAPPALHVSPLPPHYPPHNPPPPPPPKEPGLRLLFDKYGLGLIEGYALNEWVREQEKDPLYRADLKYLCRDRPIPFPADLLSEVVDPSWRPCCSHQGRRASACGVRCPVRDSGCQGWRVKIAGSLALRA